MRGAIVETGDYVGAGSESIKFHYDNDSEFFALWLGETMTYSSAMWRGPRDDLCSAQLRKIDYVANQARAAGARRVLDIGCGWGGTMSRLVEAHDVQEVLGVTLSKVQADYVSALRDPRFVVRCEDWRAFDEEEAFEAIVSLGVIEHFVNMGAEKHVRERVFREFFERCSGWLVRGGRLVVQTMVQGQVPLDRRGARDLRLVLTKMYPNAGPPSLTELVNACTGLFEILTIRNDRMDYMRTMLAWRENLWRNRQRAVELVGDELVHTHERYFDGMARYFARGQAELLRLSLAAL